jgi:hypothetical protein
MSTIEQQQNELERLQKLLSNFLSESPDTFVRNDLGDELNFQEGLPYFRRTFDLINDLNRYSLDDVPYAQLKRIADHINKTYENLIEILEFSIQKYPQNAVVTRNQFLDNIRDGYDPLSNVITPTISYLATQQTDFGKLKQSALENLEEINRLKLEFEKQQEDIQQQSNSILDSMRKASAEIGVTQHAIYFKEESEIHEKSAKFWFWLTIGIALLTIVASYIALSYFYVNLDLPTGQAIQLGISKLVVLSVLYFGILWASRNYRAHRHNSVVNKHRQNALSTFQAFVKAAGDDKATKDAVLLRATEAIFSPNTSGYLSKESDKQNSPQILEIIRTAMGKSDE